TEKTAYELLTSLEFRRVLFRSVSAAGPRLAYPFGHAVFAPQIGMPDVMVVGNADRWAVSSDLAELFAEKQPRLIVEPVIVRLIADRQSVVQGQGTGLRPGRTTH